MIPAPGQVWRRNSTGEKLVVERVWSGYARMIWPHAAKNFKFIDIPLSKFGSPTTDGFTHS